jgi:hypothetical protein
MLVASLGVSSNVRSTDPVLAEALAAGLRDSAVIRRLVAIVDASNVIVYLARGACPRPALSCLMMAGGAGGVRHVRINFQARAGLGQPGGWFRDDLSIALAHELQHAAEIAGWPDVVDSLTLQAAFRRHGVDRGGAHLDTDAAVRAGEDRRAELRRGRQ